MQTQNLPVLNFYNRPSSCFNFIYIRSFQEPHDLIRCAEHDLAKGHPETYELFKRELATQLGLDISSNKFLDLFYAEYGCLGGGYVEIFAEDSRWFKEGMKRQFWFQGKSSTYGEVDSELVKRIILGTNRFDIVGIGQMPV